MGRGKKKRTAAARGVYPATVGTAPVPAAMTVAECAERAGVGLDVLERLVKHGALATVGEGDELRILYPFRSRSANLALSAPA